MECADFPARRDAFPELQAFLERACARAGVVRDDCLRLTLLIEELFMNTVVHGHGGDTDEPVRLVLTMAPAVIGVCYEDTAFPFDPFAAPAPADDPAADLDSRDVGGVGIRLIRGMAEDVGYACRRGGGNQIRFRLPRSGGRT